MSFPVSLKSMFPELWYVKHRIVFIEHMARDFNIKDAINLEHNDFLMRLG